VKSKKTVPFQFAIDALSSLEPQVRPMFGCHAVYIGRRIVLILRDRAAHPEINGVWIATSREHHHSLRKIFPKMRSIEVLGRDPTNWQMIPAESADFERAVLRACDLIHRGDRRIGKFPTPRRRATPSRRRRISKTMRAGRNQ